jgi:superfamily II DNA or RNA helicase
MVIYTMLKIARVLSNPVIAQVDGIDDPTRLLLSDAMSYLVDGAEHMNAGNWDGRSTLFDWNNCKFPSGFVPTAIAVLKQQGYEVQTHRTPIPEVLGLMPTQDSPLVDDFPANEDYDYQFNAVKILEKHGSYIARIATGGGKSRLAALCIKRIGRKTMFVTTRKLLLYQMGISLAKSGFKVSYVGDGVWDTSGDVVLAMVQTLGERISDFKLDTAGMSSDEVKHAKTKHADKRDETFDFLETVEFVIGEEAHEAGGSTYYDVLRATRKAAYRLALTATPLMKTGEANVRLIGMFGPIRLEVSEEMLIQRGIFAKPIFKFKTLDPPPLLRRSSAWKKADELGVILNLNRNKWICAEAIRAGRYGLATMILVRRQKHGKVLADMLKQAGVRVDYIFGESNNAKRDKCLIDLKEGRLDVLIGSTILDIGVDVPAIGMLIIAGGGMAEVAHRQRIGRGARRKKSGPNVFFVVDFKDTTNKHLIKHSRHRRAIVEETPGFVEGVLGPNQDFDFEGMGFKRKGVSK